ncbi:MAG TPA: hypothetical protein VK737_00045 [Opitutales bacterium]|jgi:hypothetical protein|nr:hypothetical protein [Opitutales bacterium]
MLRLRHIPVFVVLFLAALPARAQLVEPFLLTINDSNPFDVTFTSTNSHPASLVGDVTESGGVDLVGFFTSNLIHSGPIEVGQLGGQLNLVPNGPFPLPYSNWAIDSILDPNNSLNIYLASLSPTPQFFTPALPAFNGSMGGPMLDLISFLPVNGSTGEILAGNSLFNGGPIGQWEVVNTSVPEPADFGLVAGVAAAGAFYWRRKRATRKEFRVANE